MADDRLAITDAELNKIKFDILKEKIDDISEQLGDPGRYFSSFKAKDLLNQSDCERIKAETTSIEKAMKLISVLDGRMGRKGEHPYDVFVSALKKMRVHVHIVRILNEALAVKKNELRTTKRHSYSTINGGVAATTASPTSSTSSSSLATTPSMATTPSSYLPSPHSGSSSSFSSREEQPFSSTSIKGYEKVVLCQDDQQTTPSNITDTGPMPNLPPGFNEDGSRQTDLSSIMEDHVHPDIGPLPPPPPPPSSSVDLSHDHMTSHDQLSHEQLMSHDQVVMSQDVYNVPYGTQTSDNPIVTDLMHRLRTLEQSIQEKDKLLNDVYQQLDDKTTRIQELESELSRQNEEKEALTRENNHFKLTCRRLESFIQQLRGGQIHANTPPSISPNRMYSSAYPMYPSRRVTDPHVFDATPDIHHHRVSDPGINLQVPNGSLQRPNKLYLGKTMAAQQQTDSSPSENGIEYRINNWQKQSPSPDTSHIKPVTSSYDDLSDRSSYESFGSGNANLSGTNAKGTVV